MVQLNCLPDEILVEILSRLPLKTLVICASTAKWLLNFITNPSFMIAQMNKSTKKNPSLFFRYFTENTHKQYFALQPDNDTFTGEFDLVHVPMVLSDHDGWCLSVVGSCNGLVCLCDDPSKCCYPENVILWNPSIRRRVTVPVPAMPFDGLDPDLGTCFRVVFGFGFDCGTNDFKVVRLLYRESCCSRKCEGPPTVDVYAVRSGLWRAVEGLGPVEICRREYSQCFVNGAVHWLGWRGSFISVIVTFSMKSEVFGEIMIPVSVANAQEFPSKDSKVGNCRDMLALIELKSQSSSCSVWVMREYGVVDSWTEVYKLVLPDTYPRPNAFGFRKNEEIIVVIAEGNFCENNRLILLCVRNGRVVKILGMMDGVPCSIFLDMHVESLALLKEGKVIPGNECQVDSASCSG